jgi:4-hydroxy-3-methylbut-2-enyl diphosphate reductase
MFVLHAEGSTDFRELIESTTSCDTEVHTVANLDEIRSDWLVGAATVGLAATTSAHPDLREQVITALSGLGPLSTVHRTVQTETVDGQYPIGTARPLAHRGLDAGPDDRDAHGGLRETAWSLCDSGFGT